MKKFFLSVPVIFTLILTLFAPLSVSAAEISLPTNYKLYPDGSAVDCPVSSSFSYFSADDFQRCGYNKDLFLNLQFYFRHPSSSEIFYTFSLYFYTTDSSSLNVESSDGIYHLTSSNSSFCYGTGSYRYIYSSSSLDEFCDISIPNNRVTDSISEIIFNSNTNDFYYKRSGDWEKINGIFVNIETNIFNYSPGLDLEVKFNPNLSGNLDRIIDQNGVKAESDYFSMEVINHSSKNAQFLFAIVPEGEQFSFNPKDLYGVGLDTESLKSTFFYLSQEWVYSPTITSQLPAKRVDESTYSQITPWHFISADSTIQHSFNWSQVNITKDTNYDAVVLAIPTPHDKASKVFLYDKNPHFLSLDNCQEVYRSTFSVENPVKYDSTCEEFGNYPSNGLSGLGKGTVSANAYVDKDTGEVVVEDVSAKEKAEARAEWEPGLIQNDISGFDLSSVKSILGESKAVFNFFGEALGFMPSWFWSLLILGISSIVVIGIIKALK